MLNVLTKLFDSNEKEVKKYKSLIEQINSLEKDTKKLKNLDFAKKTEAFKKRVQSGESLESILPEAFALVREASVKTIGLRPFDVQFMAAAALSRGKIAEQKTGEGKTLSAVPALYLHSLTGKNVHLVTVNDYLARRDAGWMGPVFQLLGLSVSAIINNQSFLYDSNFEAPDIHDNRLIHLKPISRKEAYQANIVYGINSEFGFDYLRDNMAQDLASTVQKEYYFAVVDEVDSVLIDEARTPHIISQPDEEPTQKYYEYASLVAKLSPDTDFKIDEKLKTAHLTDHGIGKIEKIFGVKDIYEKDFDTVYHLEASLKARTLFHKEKDYIVKDNQVILVDEFTGRLMEGRRLSEGLHQALEAKENVPIQRESKTLATVSLQNYFRMYEKLSGMTGTAVTEAEEFHKIYHVDVLVIPTNYPLVRKDHADVVYKTSRAKYTAVVDEIAKAHKSGQPVLVGTTSIDKNEIVSQLLTRRGIKHELLNAKNHEREAEIIAKAGMKGAVTVATNMAGRGVDILLGGEAPHDKESSAWRDWEKKNEEVKALGGLYVIGTERHESRRIDNQLRGRSGRQGDPGASRFFVSLDDEIMRLFGGDRIAGIMTRFNMPEEVPLTHSLVTRAIEQAQVKVEGFNFNIRKHLVEYDDVLNKQREIIYKQRREVLESDAKKEKAVLREQVLDIVTRAVGEIISMEFASLDVPFTDGEGNISTPNERIISKVTTIIPFDIASQKQLAVQLEQLPTVEEKISFMQTIATDVYKKREEELGEETMRQIERYVMLSVIDNLWMDHLDAIDNLRQGIGLRGYGQRDPLVEYKNEAFKMFETLVAGIDDEVTHRIFKVQIHNHPFDEHDHAHMVTNTPESEVSQNMQAIKRPRIKKPSTPNSELVSAVVDEKKIGRNDPCWCGSGKKWKKCHYPVAKE